MLQAIRKSIHREQGSIIVYELIVIFIFTVAMVTILQSATQELRVVRATINREQALQIAEAGVNYYQWHLAHFPTDYQDGTGQPGPYVHNYVDTDTQQTIGQFSLQITPPPLGTTITTITSTGWTLANPTVKRTVTTRYGIPSLAKYSFLTNSSIWIGNTESVNGQMQANDGIRFDGTGNAPIQSAKQTYTCYITQGSPCPTTENGVWGAAPASTQAYWQFPVPNVDFSSITSSFASMKSQAQSGGIYLAPSNAQGYSLVFNNNNTVTIYKVTSLTPNGAGWDVNGNVHNNYLDYNARTIVNGSTTDPLGNSAWPLPANGVMYIEDTTWVEGVVSGRVTVAAAVLPYNPNTAPSIRIPNNITYTARDGSVELALIAQQDVLVTYHAPSTLEVDAALSAQNGSAQFYYYPGNVKNTITTYGSIMSYGIWTWSWVDGSNNVVSGYTNTNTIYDSNLLYGPPPSFPLSNSGYQQISWTSQ